MPFLQPTKRLPIFPTKENCMWGVMIPQENCISNSYSLLRYFWLHISQHRQSTIIKCRTWLTSLRIAIHQEGTLTQSKDMWDWYNMFSFFLNPIYKNQFPTINPKINLGTCCPLIILFHNQRCNPCINIQCLEQSIKAVFNSVQQFACTIW